MSTYLIDDDGRECSACGMYKTWDKFYRSISHPHGRAAKCIACVLHEANRVPEDMDTRLGGPRAQPAGYAPSEPTLAWDWGRMAAGIDVSGEWPKARTDALRVR